MISGGITPLLVIYLASFDALNHGVNKKLKYLLKMWCRSRGPEPETEVRRTRDKEDRKLRQRVTTLKTIELEIEFRVNERRLESEYRDEKSVCATFHELTFYFFS